MLRAVLIILFIKVTTLLAQDTIYFRNNVKTTAKITDINDREIKYKKFDNLDGPSITTGKANAAAIAYANGTKETFTVEPAKIFKKNSYDYTDKEMFLKGQADAKKYYQHGGGSVGVGIACFLTGGILGLIPAIAVSTTPPAVKNLNYPNDELWKNPDYKAGYIYRAHKMKQKKVWGGYVIGTISAVIVVAILPHPSR